MQNISSFFQTVAMVTYITNFEYIIYDRLGLYDAFELYNIAYSFS